MCRIEPYQTSPRRLAMLQTRLAVCQLLAMQLAESARVWIDEPDFERFRQLVREELGGICFFVRLRSSELANVRAAILLGCEAARSRTSLPPVRQRLTWLHELLWNQSGDGARHPPVPAEAGIP